MYCHSACFLNIYGSDPFKKKDKETFETRRNKTDPFLISADSFQDIT